MIYKFGDLEIEGTSFEVIEVLNELAHIQNDQQYLSDEEPQVYEIEMEELIEYIQLNLPGLDLEIITRVLDLETEFLKQKGIIDEE